MPGNKSRLYVAMYPSGVVGNEARKYHWGFLIGPKAEIGDQVPGMQYHVKNLPQVGGGRWEFKAEKVDDVRNTNTLLARILIAKIEDEQRLITLLRNIPVNNLYPEWRCRTWVAQALRDIESDGNCVGTSKLDWEEIQAFGRKYVAEKTTAGRYKTSEGMQGPRPVYDLLAGKEANP